MARLLYLHTMRLHQTYSTAEDITEHLIKALGGSGYEQAMAQIGSRNNQAGDDVANQDGKDRC